MLLVFLGSSQKEGQMEPTIRGYKKPIVEHTQEGAAQNVICYNTSTTILHTKWLYVSLRGYYSKVDR